MKNTLRKLEQKLLQPKPKNPVLDKLKAKFKKEIQEYEQETGHDLTALRAQLVERDDPAFASFFLKPKNPGSILLTDWSSSMAGEKEDMLKKAIKTIIPNFAGTELIAFGETVVTFEYSNVDDMLTGGGTPLGEALQMAWGRNMAQIILVTDGQPTDVKPQQILMWARQHRDIPIHILGIGRSAWSDGKDDSLDEHFLRQLAHITGGSYQRFSEQQLEMLPERINQLLLSDV